MPSVIAVENLSKKYIIAHQKQMGPTTLRDTLSNSAKRFAETLLHPFVGAPKNDPAHEEFWALKDISFDIQQGDRVGIIGSNGAGKSTLLKILSRITEPSSGQIRIHGRVSSLLEVGTGFHPELSGRENVYLNGAILGMSKTEINKKFDEIIAFAEVEKFLDTPVKRYSSGMYVRLAFAVAAHLEPEILIVDEVLAVGDAQFQKKCLGKMDDVGKEGRTILFVSHNLAAMKTLCNTGILLDKGQVTFNGGVEGAVDEYLGTDKLHKNEIHWDNIADAPGNENIRLLSISVKPKKGTVLNIDSGVLIEIQFYNTIINANLDTTIHLLTIEGVPVFASGTPLSRNHDSKEGYYTATVEIPPHLLNSGIYKVTQIFGRDQCEVLYKIGDVVSFEIQDTVIRGINMPRIPGVIRPMLNWSTDYLEKKS
ncbi:MAG: ABC transporter ATP-binding protein [Gallionella sp.]|jgi:lipopolysaccharide transport system ATP-binding protein|nr:ABC transporter ATP-binding protein [Gallionella sp.]